MDTIKLKHFTEGIYTKFVYSGFYKIEMLVCFLTQIGGLVDLVKEGLIEDAGFHFEIVYVNVENDEVILFYVDDEEPRKTFRMPYEKFIKILDNWWDVFKSLPDFIEISMDDDENIEIKAVDN